MSIPKELIPTPTEELASGLEAAQAELTRHLFDLDRPLFRELIPLSRFTQQPLAATGIARLHLTGEFSMGLRQVRDQTRCDALSSFLADVIRIESFKKQ